MPTTRRRRAQEYRAPLSRPMRVFLETGDVAAACEAREPGSTGFGGGVAEVLCGSDASYRARWQEHRAELLKAAHPAKPWAFFEYEHPERRPPAVDEENVLGDDGLNEDEFS